MAFVTVPGSNGLLEYDNTASLVAGEVGDGTLSTTTGDPIMEPNYGANHWWGQFIAASSTNMMVGVPGPGGNTGIVYIHDQYGESINQMVNPNISGGTDDNDDFGASIDIDGNTCIVGAPGELASSGKAYIYNVTSAALLHTLDNPDPDSAPAGDLFGGSVAIDGNYAIVGAWAEDEDGVGSGKAYIYNVTTGALVHTLANPNAFDVAAGDAFGHNVSISGNYAAVSAPFEGSPTASYTGNVYIYNVTTGALLHTLDNPNPDAVTLFGFLMAMDGIYLAVQSPTTYGSVYVFNATTGALLHTLDNPNTTGSNHFGSAIAIDAANEVIVVGNFHDNSQSGLVYVYRVSTGTLLNTINNGNMVGGAAGDEFGSGVAIMNGKLYVGAKKETYFESAQGLIYQYQYNYTPGEGGTADVNVYPDANGTIAGGIRTFTPPNGGNPQKTYVKTRRAGETQILGELSKNYYDARV